MELLNAREIRRSYRSVTGTIPSNKTGKSVRFESTLERDYYLLQEFDDDVVEYHEQPIRILYQSVDGEESEYYPDALTIYRSGRVELVEVKYRDELEQCDPGLEAKLAAGHELARKRGWRFRIWTDVEIRTANLENVWRLIPFRNRTADHTWAHALTKMVEQNGSITIAALLSGLTTGDRLVAQCALWCLVAQRQFYVDLNTVINGSSVLTIFKNDGQI